MYNFLTKLFCYQSHCHVVIKCQQTMLWLGSSIILNRLVPMAMFKLFIYLHPCYHFMFNCLLSFRKIPIFFCPGFNDVKRKTCGAKLSYQEICQRIPLTDKQREFLEENLAALVARRLFDFKTVRLFHLSAVCMHAVAPQCST